MKVVTIVGARPQFIKASPVSDALRREHTEILVHTGQHYDHDMSEVFFNELKIPKPNYNLNVRSGLHGQQTGTMMARIEETLIAEQPNWVLVYGDTNSTLAGALAAIKLHIPVAHVEAGLRSFNREMPEEHNRVLTDHCSNLLLCPTQTAVDNLAKEGITEGVHLVGDVMYDAVKKFGSLAKKQAKILNQLKLNPKKYLLATIHRAYNTDDPERLKQILNAFGNIQETIIFPIHPRTRKRIAEFGLNNLLDAISKTVHLIEPVGYLDMLSLEQHARLIITDSGGIQKEAYFFEVPCITLRPETEWVETVTAKWNILANIDDEIILNAVHKKNWPQKQPPPVFGDGEAAEKIVCLMKKPLPN